MDHRLRRSEELSSEQLCDMLAGDPREAAKGILAAAKSGLVEAQVMLGQILLEGRGIERDPVLAATWFRIGANQGNAMALNMLGRCLEHGWGCAEDLVAAAAHFRQAAAQGLDWGMYNYANLLATGRGVARNEQAAFDFYRRAAERGHAKSLNLLGRCYEEGIGVSADPRQALDCYRRSAQAGDFRGQYSYAAVLMSLGEWQQARHWLQQALELGHLKFLRKASAELRAAALPQIQDITDAYLHRCAALEATEA